MAITLSEIRAKLQANEARKPGARKQTENAVFPHWNIPEGTTARVRYLPDADSKNPLFWVTREIIRLPFAGIKGQEDSKPTIVQVPCMEMYEGTGSCPILTEARSWFKQKDAGMEELGRKYWKKKSYLFQGFVHENPLGSDDAISENPIRRFIISPQIFNLIATSLKDPEMENLPTDYETGLDFNIKKTSKGGYADYSTSSFSRRETALTSVEKAAIDQYGLFNLADFLPKKPNEVELQVIAQMFEASVNGEAYDPDRWASYYKPSGFKVEGSGDDSDAESDSEIHRPTLVSVPKTSHVDEDDSSSEDEGTSSASAPVVTPAPKAGNDKAAEILAMIRNRTTK